MHAIDALFVTDWYSETDVLLTSTQEQATAEQHQGALLAQVSPSGPAFPTENNLALFNSLMYHASGGSASRAPTSSPTSPCWRPSPPRPAAGWTSSCSSARSGTSSSSSTPSTPTTRSCSPAGVRIYLYPRPAILHAKHISVDDDVAVVGSSNMDIRSFQLDLELMLMVCGRTFVDEMRAVEDEYRRVSRELTPASWSRRGVLHRTVDDFTRLTSAVQ